MSQGWARFALNHYSRLKRWRDYAASIAKACREILGRHCRSVYVVGGAAEERLTVLSDIDVVLVVDEQRLKTLENIVRVRRRAEELGLPVDIPVDIKILVEEEFMELTRKGVYRRVVRIDS